jgi:hypothetical protein
MDRRGLEQTSLNNPGTGLELDPSLETPPKVLLNVIRRNLADGSITGRPPKMPARSFVGLVRLRGADRRLRIVLQKILDPIRKL